MRQIVSGNNPLYREIRQLAGSARARRKANRTILDGIHLCQSYLLHIGSPIFCVVNELSQSLPEIAEIIAACLDRRVSCLLLQHALYKEISQVEEGAGICFIIEPPVCPLPENLVQTVVLLDRVQDPGNLGSILRSASAAGIQDVFCSAGTASAWSPRVLRAGMGAHFMVRIYEDVDLEKLAGQSALPLVATLPDAGQAIYDVDLKQPVAWLFGHEGQGISNSLQAKSHIKLCVPHAGKQDSLNVAACAAICFFEQLRQARAGRLGQKA
ncbi:MAG: RNA methyltransferase [Oxalobacter formigenes]|nr:RNA methyltransferase [Oxalobacter formigenes]